jgi:serine phosphatase RsbU (regulator of sigma subunit)
MAGTEVRPRSRPRRQTNTLGRLHRHVRRRLLPSDGFLLVLLGALAWLLCYLSVVCTDWAPTAMLVIPVLVGGFVLRMRSLVQLYLLVAMALVLEAMLRTGAQAVMPGEVAVVAVAASLVLLMSRMRARLGVQGSRGESMLFDLRDRLRAQGEMPALPEGWQAEVVLRSAGGQSFSGDFLVATRSRDGRLLELALVDVSGKGIAAGARALLLSGAFGGLLGSLSRREFLPAANDYVFRQGWEEGFATAAHVVLDLDTGEFEVRNAGHPPGAQFAAGSGRWEVLDGEGPLLGVLTDAEYTPSVGRLGPGDALLLYTDGLVEVPGRDLSVGIDRLLGEAERLVTRGFRHGARKLIDAVAKDVGDDRALVLLWRT